jgi:hypothetical protein
MSLFSDLPKEEQFLLGSCADDYEPYEIVEGMYESEFGEFSKEVLQGHLISLLSKGLLDYWHADEQNHLSKIPPERVEFRHWVDLFYVSDKGMSAVTEGYK